MDQDNSTMRNDEIEAAFKTHYRNWLEWKELQHRASCAKTKATKIPQPAVPARADGAVEEETERAQRMYQQQDANQRLTILAAMATHKLPAEVNLIILTALIATHLPIAELESVESFIKLRNSLLGDSTHARALHLTFMEALLKTAHVRLPAAQWSAADVSHLLKIVPHAIRHLEIVCDSTAACCPRSSPMRQLRPPPLGFFHRVQLLREIEALAKLTKPSANSRLSSLRSLTLAVNFKVTSCHMHVHLPYWYTDNRGEPTYRKSDTHSSPIATLAELIQDFQLLPTAGQKLLKVTTTRTRKERSVEKEVQIDACQDLGTVLAHVVHFGV